MSELSLMASEQESNMQQIIEIVRTVFPKEDLKCIHDHGYWVNEEDYQSIQEHNGDTWRGKRIIKFQLKNGKRYCVKLANSDDEWENAFTSELITYALLSKYTEIPVPEIVTTDLTKRLIDTNYIILSQLDGIKLSTVWLQSDERTKMEIYQEIGRTYQQIHNIKGKTSGLFKTLEDPYEVRFPVHPNDFMLENEIRNGSGSQAVKENVITKNTYRKIIELWENNLEYLKDHESTLIHYSAFCWTIALQYSTSWSVSRLTGGGMMWWDPAIDLSLFKYSHFMKINAKHWGAFQEGYGGEVESKRIALYGLFTKLLAAMGVYYEPKYLRNPYLRNNLNTEIERIIDEIE